MSHLGSPRVFPCSCPKRRRQREKERKEGGERQKPSPNNHGLPVLPFSLIGPNLDTGSSLVQRPPVEDGDVLTSEPRNGEKGNQTGALCKRNKSAPLGPPEPPRPHSGSYRSVDRMGLRTEPCGMPPETSQPSNSFYIHLKIVTRPYISPYCPRTWQGVGFSMHSNAYLSSAGALQGCPHRGLEQRSASFSHKGPDSKYFRLCSLYGLCHNYPTLPVLCISCIF